MYTSVLQHLQFQYIYFKFVRTSYGTTLMRQYATPSMYRIDEQVVDAHPKQEWPTNVSISEVLVPVLVIPYKSGFGELVGKSMEHTHSLADG